MMFSLKHAFAYGLLTLLVACSSNGDSTQSPSEGTPTATATPEPPPNLQGPFPYDSLSEYGLFRQPMAAMEPKTGVILYEPVSPLWTDGAQKGRFVILPEGTSVSFTAEGAFQWPVGTVLIKNFFFALDAREPDGDYKIIETRLLIHDSEGDWSRYTYVWNDEQTEAYNTEAGKLLNLSLVDDTGAAVSQLYQVPNTNQCGNCHEVDDTFHPLGPVVEQLNFNSESGEQLAWLESQGVFSGVPSDTSDLPALVDPMVDGDLNWRARSYLHANCAHCHQPGGDAHKSGLYLSAYEEDPQAYGVCKEPVAAGGGSGDFHYDIVPGNPDESIMIYRMESSDSDEKMPEIGTLVVHQAGSQLIRDWIAAMEPVDCDQWGTLQE